MKNMKYKYLLFDADGTLFDFRRAEREALCRSFQASGLFCEDSTYNLYSEINENIWKEYEQGLVSKEKLKILRFSRLLAHLDHKPDPKNLAREYLVQLGQCGYLYAGAADLCRDLARDFELAIITNGIASVQYPRFHSSPLADIIPKMFISEEVGFQKPQIEFFTHVLNDLGIDNINEALIIGDSLTADIQGGSNASIDTCWYNPEKLANDTDIKPTYEIAKLQSIYAIVKT